MKKILILFFLALVNCSSGTDGVGLSFIRDEFNLPSTNPLIVNIDETGACPKIEFDDNSTTFKIRLEPGNPSDAQSTFAYEDDNFKQELEKRILTGTNEESSTFEFTYDNETTYTLTIDYNCMNATDPDCANTTYSCSGPLL
jgi:hypothetical protein